MATIEEDRAFVVENWQYLFGRKPTMYELEREVGNLQRGLPRRDWWAYLEKVGAEDAVTRMYREVLGRDPDPEGMAHYSAALKNGTMTRATLRSTLAGSAEALLKDRSQANSIPEGAEDARVYLKTILDNYGLGDLDGWAWDQLKEGHSTVRVMQELRQRPEYKQRFQGLEIRKQKGLPAMSEADYIAYEQSVRQLMRAAGLPEGFYDQVEDFANFIGNDVSYAEMQARINEGYQAAMAAPQEVRDQLERLYGVTPGGIAAFFLDETKALPLVQQAYTASKIAGAAVRTGYDALERIEAERLSALNLTDQQAQEGFSQLARMGELFEQLPGESGTAIQRNDQLAAIFEGNVDAQQTITRRAETRVAVGSGGRSFVVGNQGVAGLAQQ